MLKTCRGLVLATGIMSLPLFAQADCPPVDSIDRYAQTAGDALSALHELVPESQQRALEDRYAAMVMLKWQWQGREAIRQDKEAMTQLLACYAQAACGIQASDGITTQIVAKLSESNADPLLLESLLPRAPSDSAYAWAQRTLGCDAPSPVAIDATQIETAAIETPAPDPIDESVVQSQPEDTISIASLDRQDSEPAATAFRAPGTVSDGVILPASALRAATSGVEPERRIIPVDETPVVQAVASTIVADDIDPLPTPRVPLPTTNENVNALMATATSLIAQGKPGEAIEPLETACFMEAPNVTKSSACETLFGVYTNSLVARTTSGSSNAYLDLSERLCAIGHSAGCDNLSRFYSAQNSPEAHRAAVSYAEQSCDLNNAEACAIVSGFYLSGRASEPDPSAAREKLEQSCALGRLLSCQEVADFHARGVGGPADPMMALQMIEASCPENSTKRADLCVSAADYVLIHEAPGIERGQRVRTFIKRACEIGHDVGCAWYAEDLELGIGGDVDLAAARQARLTACEFGDQESCNSRS